MLLIISVLFSCDSGSKGNENSIININEEIVEITQLSKAEIIINSAITAHGGALYDEANYSFVFREREYSFKNNETDYSYTVISVKDEIENITSLTNNELSQTLNGEITILSDNEVARYTGALNSVIYFATLPHKLKDRAVHKKWIESTTIKGQEYDVIEVTFDSEGGGKDHDDEFHYWINQKTKTMDYFAYNYSVNEGGIRYRSAYNSRVVDGIRFQDYVNYEAEIGTPLRKLPALYEKGELKELSKIITENVINLKQ